MVVTEYEMNPTEVADIVADVEGKLDAVGTKRSTLSEEIDGAAAGCKRPEISGALFALWNELLLPQCEAAQTRIENACNAVNTAAAAFIEGDLAMVSEASTASGARPNLDLEGGKKDAGS